MSADPNAARAIFMAALDKSEPAERAAYLAQACGSDDALRQRVEVLLKANDDPGSFLKSPANPAATVDEPATSDRLGTVIGPYKLLQQIGEGGMGTVYMAEQMQPVRRKVALKIIKPGMDSRQVIARFEAERQALAMMDHVNIARVLDAGATDNGRPYFVMELVHGVPITKYCDGNHLTPRERLELFVPVCQAIQHAHQKGIIHRDIKPSNVLVTLYDGKPVPKVIDFGVAKATEQKLTERTLFTQYGAVVGTLEYMSPEQAELSAQGIDTRSDIYSLGVLLYELLTGSTPLTRKRMKEAAYAEILRMIKEVEPPKPSTRLSDSGEALASISAQRHMEPAKLAKLMRGELDWIVMKCLEKDRNRRYETANAFAVDVQQYLHGEAVLACPPSATYRLRKFARRNRAAFWTTGVVALALVAGTAVSIWQAVRATRAEGLADARIAAESLARQDAENNFRMAQQAVDKYFTRVSQSRLFDVPGLQLLRKELLQEALGFYEGLRDERGGDPALQADLAGAYLRMAQIYLAVNSTDDAVSALNKALEIVERLVREHPNNTELYRRLAGIYQGERRIHIDSRNPTNPQVTLDALQRFVGIWEKLAREDSGLPGFQSNLAITHFYMGATYGGMGHMKEARQSFQKSWHIRENLVRQWPLVGEYRADLSETMNALVAIGFGAETPCRQVVDLTEKLVAESPNVPRYKECLAGIYGSLASLLRANGKSSEAKNTRAKEVEIWSALAFEFPMLPGYRRQLSAAQHSLGNLLKDSGRPMEAESAFREAFSLRANLLAEYPSGPDYAGAFDRVSAELVDLLKERGEIGEAGKVRSQAISVYEKLAAANPKVADYREHIGQLYSNSGQWEKAVVEYTRAIELQPDRWEGWFRRGQAYFNRQLWDKALTDFSKAIELNPQHANPSLLGDALYLRAFSYGVLGQSDKEIADYTTAIELNPGNSWHWLHRAQAYAKLQQWPSTVADSTRAIELKADAVEAWRTRGDAHAALGQWDKAVADYAKAIELNPAACAGLTEQLKAKGRLQETETLIRQAIEHFEKLALARDFPGRASHSAWLAGSYRTLAEVQSARNQPKEAEKSLRQALDLQEKVVADFPAAHTHQDELARTQLDLAVVLQKRGRAPEAQAAYRQALAGFERLVIAFPKAANYQTQLLQTAKALNQLLDVSGQPQKKGEVLDLVFAVHEKLTAQSSKTPEDLKAMFIAYQDLTTFLSDNGRSKDAAEAYRKNLEFLEKELVTLAPADPAIREQLALSYSQLADMYEYSLKQPSEAEKQHRKSLDLFKELLASSPKNNSYLARVAHQHKDLALFLRRASRPREAIASLRDAIVFQKLAGENPNDRFRLHYFKIELGILLVAQNQREEGESLWRQGLDSYARLLVDTPGGPPNHSSWWIGQITVLVEHLKSTGRPQEAERLLRESIAIFDSSAANLPALSTDPAYRLLVAHTHNSLGHILWNERQTQAGEKECREAVELFKKLAAEFPNNAEYRTRVATCHSQLGGVFAGYNQPREAEQTYRLAIEAFEKLGADFPGQPSYRAESGWTCRKLASLLVRLPNRFRDAEEMHARDVSIFEKLVAELTDNPLWPEQLAHGHRQRGFDLSETKRSREAEKCFREAIKVLEGSSAKFPNAVPSHSALLADTSGVLARLLATDGRLQEADKVSRQSLDVLEELASESGKASFSSPLATGYINLARLLHANNQSGQAEKVYERGRTFLEVRQAQFPDQTEYRHDLGRIHNHLGLLLASTGQGPEAEKAHQQALDLYEKLAQAKLPPERDRWRRQELMWTQENLGRVRAKGGRPNEAEKAFRQAIVLGQQLNSEFPDQGYTDWVANEYGNLATLFAALGRADEAEKAYNKLLELAPQSAFGHNNLAWLLATCPDAKLRNPQKAVTLAKKAVELDPKQGMWWNTLGVAHYRAGDVKAAISALEKSMELRPGGDAYDWFFLALAHWQLGEKEKARKWYDRAVQWMEKNQPKNEELVRFRAEAEKLLELKK